MDRTRTLKLTLLAGAAVTLQGCVAAIGPIAAASGILGGSVTREGNDSMVAAAPAPEPTPTIEPTVIVERSDQRREERPALATETSEPMGEPGRDTMASTELETSAEPISSSVTGGETDQPTAIATMAEADPFAPGRTGQTSAFTTSGDEPPVSVSEPETASPATELALSTPPASQPDPVVRQAPEYGPVPAEQRASGDTPVRIIAVDPQVALADRSATTASVSAAEAAAALTAIEAARESEPTPAALARTPRVAARQVQSQPSATPVAASGMTSDPAPAERLAMSSTTASTVAVPPPSAPPRQPAPPAAAERTAPRPMATGAFASLINYANRQQARSAENRASAVLADRASLMPTRAACGDADPTVLIDLDPDGDTFDPTDVPRAAPGLANALAQMRASGVKIAWISTNAQGQVGAIREALNRSGLDLDNSDQLLLMRYPEDRKQTRREDLAASSCLIAIAGDKRTDFDELFEYLLNPEAAAALDPLIENGWFLIPQPLATERP